MSGDERPRSHERWAHLRFGVVGGLLASPPVSGELRAELLRLAEKPWRHPTTGELVRFSLSTIERWYYAARSGSNPVGVLHRKLRADSGRFLAIKDELAQALRRQYKEHPSWSYKLHLDNLAVRIALDPDLGTAPSYPTLRRFMAAQGLLRQARRRGRQEPEGEIRARAHLASREVRSFESEYVSGLWHLDFHHGSLKVLRPEGEWVRPILLAILDDRSRLICHAQWYLDETTESLVHGLGQAFLKRGLPRSLLSDNGSAMIARETSEGLARLSVTQATTLPYSPSSPLVKIDPLVLSKSGPPKIRAWQWLGGGLGAGPGGPQKSTVGVTGRRPSFKAPVLPIVVPEALACATAVGRF